MDHTFGLMGCKGGETMSFNEEVGIHYDDRTETLTIILREDYTEFSDELGRFGSLQGKHLRDRIHQIVDANRQYRSIKVVKIIIGPVVAATILWNSGHASSATRFNLGYLYFGSTSQQISFVDRTYGSISVASPSYFDIHEDGNLDIANLDTRFIDEIHRKGKKVVPFLSNHWDRAVGRAALENRVQLAQQIADVISKYNLDGVNVDIENVTETDRSSYTDLVRLLREKIPSEKEVSVAVAANPNGWEKGWHGSYDYKELARYSDYLLLMAYDESWAGSPPGPVASLPFVEKSIRYAFSQGVRPEKVVLGLPHYGRYWEHGKSYGGTGITNNVVQSLLQSHSNIVTYDVESGSPKAVITVGPDEPVSYVNGKALRPGEYTVWFENDESIHAKVALVSKYGLKGTGSWALGQESASLWSKFKNWIVDKSEIDVPLVTGRVGITTTNVNLRIGPSTISEVLTMLDKGELVKITGGAISGGSYQWLPIELDSGLTGYAASDFIKEREYEELHGSNRYETSAVISQRGWPEGADTVLLGRGDVPVDALAGSVLATKLDAPLLLTATDRIPDTILDEITRLNPQTIYLLGGSSAISEVAESQLIHKGYSIKRITGKDRFDTSVKVAEELNSDTEEIFITTGTDSPDPLSIAPYSGMKQIPILLAGKEHLPESTMAYILNNHIKRVTIVGGINAVSVDIEHQLKAAKVIGVERISGTDRFDTSVEIAKRYQQDFPEGSSLFFASGRSFVDALAGSTLAAKQNSPIVLLEEKKIPSPVSQWLNDTKMNKDLSIKILGGYNVISKDVRIELMKR
ncbi:cell wall-binding repeat-containing protein [Bacillus salacetis]|uniref:cell wall-binding repeat-containing protein n=1 Tax=Bacillus salacetis TaxID=2315464 RepID=UPI003B9DDB93